MSPPFVVFALPRSRTWWLSRFLNYGGWLCGHDETRHVRHIEDVKSWLAMPQTGTVETAAAPFWRTLQKLAPTARVVVVRRDPSAVFASMMRLEGVRFDPRLLARTLRGLDTKLDQITARWPDALSVRFADLEYEATCAAVFEHCLGLPHDPAWWAALAPLNLQCDMAGYMRYFAGHRAQLTKAAAMVGQQSLAALRLRPVVPPDGITFQIEPFDEWFDAAQPLFRDHLVAVGEAPDQAAAKNVPLLRQIAGIGAMQIMTARSNGRMFGYLMTLLAPSLEDAARRTAVHTTFYGDPAVPGLGMKLQRAALAALRERGIDDVFWRAGPRGAGPRMGALYRRLGAVPDGETFRLDLTEA